MEPTLSFVIPILNEAERIGPLLESLQNRYPEAEIIVVDGGSQDSSVPIAMPRCDQLMISRPGRALQMNLGGQVASGEFVFFLHADTAPSVAQEDLYRELAMRPTWGFSRVRLSGGQIQFRIIERWMNQRSRFTHVATGDQMMFVRRDIFESTQGFAGIPLMEDVEYSKRLRKLGSPRILADPVTASSRRWEENGILRTVLKMWCLRLAYVLGVPPRRLHQQYYGA